MNGGTLCFKKRFSANLRQTNIPKYSADRPI